MPTYKVVLFYDTTDVPQQQYMKEQMNAIKNSLPELSVELAPSTDFRLALYSTIPQRMPCIMIFKNDARMQTKHAKLQHPEAINWIRSRIQ